MTNEVKTARIWLFKLLKNYTRLSAGIDILRLIDINTAEPEGERLRAAAELILTNLNISDAKEISLTQVRDVQSIMASAANNGDGIIPTSAISEPDLSQFVTAVMESVGSVSDAGGKPGIGREQLDMFFNEAQAYLDWKAKGKASEVMPWGDQTPSAFGLVSALEEKIDQYFAQCAMVGFDERTVTQIQFSQKELEEIDFKDKVMMQSCLKDAPLAALNSKGILDLKGKLNPMYIDILFDFKEKILNRVLGKDIKELTQEKWRKVKNIFTSYRVWLTGKQGAKVEKLGEERLRVYLDGSYREQIDNLIQKDLAVADNLNQIHDLEKLILYQKWLMELVNNFISFTNLYHPKRRALFETGTLIIDGRQITFTMKVYDRKEHKRIAEKSCMYLLYLEISGRRNNDIKFEIVAPVTSGNAGGLRVGKRGVFFTRDGKEWEAQVVDIIVNPISAWESVKAPFQKVAGFIKKQIDKFTKSGQSQMDKTLSAPSASGMTRDLMLGGGIAIAAIGSAFAYITKALSEVNKLHVLVALLVLVAVVFLPIIITGFIKIRKRNLSVLLEASGWAVNMYMRLNTSLGRLFTHRPRLPKGARKERKDVVAQFIKEIGRPSLSLKWSTVLFAIIFIEIIFILIIILFPY
jgi:hypothetical protein